MFSMILDGQEASEMGEMDFERPEADWIDQDRVAAPEDDEPEAGADQAEQGMPLEVNEADAAEQDRDLGADDDDYR
jgi:hypothetical protein